MKRTPKFPSEVRVRAVRRVQRSRSEFPSLWAAVESIARQIGCAPQTLLEWVRRDELARTLREREGRSA